MSDADCFTWHPDQDDVYNGNKCGSMTLSGPPSKFNKIQAYGFTAEGAPEDTLTLEAIPTTGDVATYWPEQKSISAKTSFNIASGTFRYKSTNGAINIGNSLGGMAPNFWLTVIGHCILEASEVTGYNAGMTLPGTEIDIRETGVLSVAASLCTSALIVKINDMGAMKINAGTIAINFSDYTVDSIPPNNGYSLDLAPWQPLPTEGQSISLENTSIICQSQSKNRLRSKSIELDSSVIRAESNAMVEFACDLFTIDSTSLFTLSSGSGAFRFSNANGDKSLPIDEKTTPSGIFNFITTEGENSGVFCLRATSQADARKQWLLALLHGWFAIDGTATTGQAVNGYKVNGTAFDGTYMIAFLEKA